MRRYVSLNKASTPLSAASQTERRKKVNFSDAKKIKGGGGVSSFKSTFLCTLLPAAFLHDLTATNKKSQGVFDKASPSGGQRGWC